MQSYNQLRICFFSEILEIKHIQCDVFPSQLVTYFGVFLSISKSNVKAFTDIDNFSIFIHWLMYLNRNFSVIYFHSPYFRVSSTCYEIFISASLKTILHFFKIYIKLSFNLYHVFHVSLLVHALTWLKMNIITGLLALYVFLPS